MPRNQSRPKVFAYATKVAVTGNETALQTGLQKPLQNQQNHVHASGVECPACARTGQKLQSVEADLSCLTYADAFPVWFAWKSRSLKPGRAIDAHQQYRSALGRFFDPLALRSIHAGHLREYQLARLDNTGGHWARACGPSGINHELNALAQMLDYCNCWEPVKKYYQPLPMPKWTPKRVMTFEEEKLMMTVSWEDADAQLAVLVAAITANTTASGTELRGLRLEHVSLETTPPEIRVPDDSVKNEYRARRIPLNPTAKRAVELCYKRALRLGSCRPEHYLFPFRVVRNTFDPTQPASRSWLRKSWDRLRKKTGLEWLRPHDLRHQAITRMLENGSPEETVMAIAGHVSRKMLEHYSHIRMEPKWDVLNAIDPGAYQKPAPIARGRRYMA